MPDDSHPSARLPTEPPDPGGGSGIDLRAAYATQRAVAEVLQLALGDAPLDDALDSALAGVLSLPWLDSERGCVFAVDSAAPRELVMRAAIGMSDDCRESCRRVPFGRCLCGQVADTGAPVTSAHVGDRHDSCGGPGAADHGHYCLPLRAGGDLLGVLCTYLPAGHAEDAGELELLAVLADALAGLIERDRARRGHDELARQYLHAQKLEAVGRLAGGVAHDFNNLLSVIAGCAALVKEDMVAGDPAREDMDEIEQTVARAAALTRQLLAFSRREISEPVALVIDDALASMAKMLGRILGDSYDLALELDSGGAVALIDGGLFEQAVVNLVVNARDALPGGGAIRIETRRVRDGAGERVAIAVADRGCGISGEVLEHIFEPFFTTKERGSGTGLGLSTTHGIVQQAGGAISVDSRVGEGTTFEIRLPVTAGAAAGAESAPAPAISLDGVTVLLAEDDGRVRRVVRRLLQRAGAAVLEATGGREAILISRGHTGPIDVLLSDLVMPEVDGVTVATALLGERPALGIVFMSGYADDELSRRLELAGRFELVRKPFEDRRLIGAVHAAVATR